MQSDLGLGSTESVEPQLIAELLGIEVRAGDELIPRERFEELRKIQPDAFSACTLRPSPERMVVVYNPLSPETRQRSDIAHELAHTLLDHELSQVRKLGGVPFLSCDPVQEEEAALVVWMSPAAQGVALGRDSEGSLCSGHSQKAWCESERMAQYRLDVTGVVRQSQASAKKRSQE